MKRSLLVFALFIIITPLFSQTKLLVGKWRTHFSYTTGLKVAEAGNEIYCLTQSGLFFIDKKENEMSTLTKIDGLSDFEVSTFDYDAVNKTLIVAYQNCMIDLIKTKSITQVTELYRKSIPGKKIINNIYLYNNKAYLSCSFGIVVYDLLKLEVKETYSEIGANGSSPEIFQTAILNGNIYAATSEGILKASLSSPNLLDFKSWTNIKPVLSKQIIPFTTYLYCFSGSSFEKYDGANWSTAIAGFNDTVNSMVVNYRKLVVNSRNSGIYLMDTNFSIQKVNSNNDNFVILDADGNIWHAVNIYSLVRTNGSESYFYTPTGPLTNKCWDVKSSGNKVWVVPGYVSESFKPAYNSAGLYTFYDNSWTNNSSSGVYKFNSFTDLMCMATDPVNGHLYIGSFEQGLLEYYNDGIQTVYDESNSTLTHGAQDTSKTKKVIVTGIAFDSKRNLWVSNRTATNQLSVKSSTGKWSSYNLGSNTNTSVSKIIVDEYDTKWIQLDEGLLVFNETQTGTQYKKLSQGSGNGNLGSNGIVHSIAKDLDGKIWVGTEEGVEVFYDPYAVFSDGNYDAQKVWVENGDNSGYLLGTETVTAIAVDGANNKWLGTKRGIWYVSDDGSKILLSFNTKNSPLPSDYIRSIGINNTTGEVFIATDKGLVSYRNVATESAESHSRVLAYPNPVRPEYKGPITITGLMRDDDVKITDIAGNMVYEAKSEGGQMSWDGRNFNGNSVRTGVYLIFCSNPDGTDTYVSKIMIIR